MDIGHRAGGESKLAVIRDRLAEAAATAGQLIFQNERLTLENQALAEERDTLLDENQTLKEAARTDELTGLQNELAMQEQFDEFVAGGVRFGMLNIDLRGFCAVNCQIKHSGGDTMLKTFAGCIRSTRSTDSSFRREPDQRYDHTAIRQHGDEFAVMVVLEPEAHDQQDRRDGDEPAPYDAETSLRLMGERFKRLYENHTDVLEYNRTHRHTAEPELGMRYGLALYEAGMTLNDLLNASESKGKQAETADPAAAGNRLLRRLAINGLRTAAAGLQRRADRLAG